jgi:protein-S-isoprenylcysteine O-methyltransferase Ste14
VDAPTAKLIVLARALTGFVFLHALVALVLFGLAGSIEFWQGWLFLTIFAVLTLAITLYLFVRDPDLLERRSRGGPTAETRPRQKLIQIIASAAFLACLIVPSLEWRAAGGSTLPIAVVAAGEVMVAVGLGIVFAVFRANTFASATVEVAQAQTVIETGPYRIVRHPMYVGGIVLGLGIPLALGSAWGLIGSASLTAAIVWRLLDEETLLRRELPGYSAYCAKTRYRLIPRVW